MRAPIRLLSTDFDGTVVDTFVSTKIPARLAVCIAGLQAKGAVWAINTGRTVPMLVEGLVGFDVQPDFILTSERDVFRRSVSGNWEDFGDWNSRCATAHAKLNALARDHLADIVRFIRRDTRAELFHENGHVSGMIAKSEEEMDRIIAYLDAARPRMPELHYQRNMIYLRFCHEDYHKGTALGELARLLELGPESIFAAGDNYNDLPMLDPAYASWLACPVNAIEPVKQRVSESGGHVASAIAGEGIAEALELFCSKT